MLCASSASLHSPVCPVVEVDDNGVSNFVIKIKTYDSSNTNKTSDKMKLILSAIFVQIIFLISVFDIHFQSPVVKGLIPHANPVPSPAKRLVLISADGLRFDTFLSFGYDREPNAPFLRY